MERAQPRGYAKARHNKAKEKGEEGLIFGAGLTAEPTLITTSAFGFAGCLYTKKNHEVVGLVLVMRAIIKPTKQNGK